MWTEYLTIMGILVLAWYGVMIPFFYREEIKDLLSGKRFKKGKVIVRKREEAVMEDDNSLAELEGLVEDIRHSILVKAGKEVGKEALLTRLKERLTNYGGLHKPAYRVALNNFIINQAKELCGVAFKEEELEEAWKELLR